MRFQKEVNIFAPDAILKRFQANETNFSVVKGKIEVLISESEILELQNSKVTMYSKLADVKLTVDGLEQTYTDITSKYDAVSGKYTDLDACYYPGQDRWPVLNYITDLRHRIRCSAETCIC